MYLHYDLERYIISFINPNATCLTTNKGRCLCFTHKQRRCKKKVDYSTQLICTTHSNYYKNIKCVSLISYIKKSPLSYLQH